MEIRSKDHSSVAASSYTARQWSMIALVGVTLIPLVLVRFFGVGGSAATIAVATGLAIVAASFALSWGVEALEGVMPQGVALAILALIEERPV
jgi:hypothetical protein